MKKIIISAIALGLTATSSIAFATTTIATTTTGAPWRETREEQKRLRKDFREEQKETRKEEREDKKELHEELKKNKRIFSIATSTASTSTPSRDEVKARKEERRKKAGIMRAEYLVKRLERRVTMLENYANKIDAQLTVLGNTGVNVIQAHENLALARTKIVKAKGDVAIVKTGVGAAITAPHVNEALKALKGKIRIAEKSTREAQRALHTAINFRSKHTGTATSTATTTAQ
jgi:hypothetical protein